MVSSPAFPLKPPSVASRLLQPSPGLASLRLEIAPGPEEDRIMLAVRTPPPVPLPPPFKTHYTVDTHHIVSGIFPGHNLMFFFIEVQYFGIAVGTPCVKNIFLEHCRALDKGGLFPN